ncbi:MAG: cupredoxin domain-containing protein [Pseudomonadota bacterium]
MKKLLLLALLLPLSAFAADYTLVIKDHQFEPAELTIPAATKIKLIVENRDATPEEFESYTLNREKIIAGHSKATLFIGPLEPGRYEFFGEFNPESARGVIIAK